MKDKLVLATVQGLCAGIGFGIVLLVGVGVWCPQSVEAQSGIQNNIRTRSLSIVDSRGRERIIIRLSSTEDSSIIDMTGKSDAKSRTQLIASDSGHLFSLSGKSGTKVTVGAFPNGSSISMRDPSGKDVVTLSAYANGSSISTRDPLGKGGISLFTGGESGSSISMRDPSEKERVKLRASDIGSSLSLADGLGKERVQLSYQFNTPSLFLTDNSQTGVSLSASGHGPFISLKDQSGTQVFLSAIDGQPEMHLADAAGKTRGQIAMWENGASMSLYDKAGIGRATLGACSLVTKSTEAVTTYPESSLVLFDKEGKLLLQLPR
jgi:hypothetical protein